MAPRPRVAIARARSVDELFEQVAGYDRVITADAPLCLALNRRIDRPKLGSFAATPRMLASGEFRPADRRDLFLAVIDETALTWQQAASIVELVIGCWEETGDLQAILEYDGFDTPAIRSVVDTVASTPSAHRDVAEYTPDPDESVAVIGIDQFSALDRSVLPPSYDTVSMLDDAATIDPPVVSCFDSPDAIVETVVDTIRRTTPEEVAIVMDGGGPYGPLVESALAVGDIPFHGGPDLIDDLGVRTYLRLLHLSRSGRVLRLRDVDPVLAFLGESMPTADAHKHIARIDDPRLDALKALFESIASQTFAGVADWLVERSDRQLDELYDVLRTLDIDDTPVTEARIDDLSFYLETFDVRIEQDNEGVLLADPASAAYVDRPLVFYLGVDDDWTQRIPDRPWVDRELHDRRHLERFQVLIQNGQTREFLVQETADGTPVTPCLYFYDLLDASPESFADFDSQRYGRPDRDHQVAFERVPLGIDPGRDEVFSQSRLNTFVNSPRDYLFSQVVEAADRDYFTKGTLVHDFAEFAVAHPEVVEQTGRDTFVDSMLDELAPFVDELALPTIRTELTVAVDTVLAFLEANPPAAIDYAGYRPSTGSNTFAEAFDRPINTSTTEQYFENVELGGRGLVDLIVSRSQLADFKTSASAPSQGSLVRRSRHDPIDDTPDFQAPMYLAHHRGVVSEDAIEFTYVYVLAVLEDALGGSFSLDDATVTIPYHDTTVPAFVASQTAFDALTTGVAESNPRRKTLERLGYDRYASFFSEHPFPPGATEADDVLETEFHTAFTEYTRDYVGTYKYVTKGSTSALKQLVRLRRERFFEPDLDAFEAFLREQLDRLNEYRRGSFPVGDPNEDRLNHPDLLRPDD